MISLLLLFAASGLMTSGDETRICACCTRYNDKNIHQEDKIVTELNNRAKKQRAAAAKLSVFHDFSFSDQRARSGITFVHKIVDDAGRDWKPVHYDHGNGIVVADVDGDGLTDLYLLSQLGGNQLWRNRGDGSFENITQKAGVAVAGRIGVSAVFGDIDNDGDADLYVTTVRGGNLLFQNNGKGIFRDITAAAGLTYSGHSSAALFFDYDNDGLLDLLLTNVGVYTTEEKGNGGYYIGYKDAFAGHLKTQRNEASILYRNLGKNRFADVSVQTGFNDTSWSGDAAITDLNGDRFPDVYLFNMQGDDHYYENKAGKTFTEISADLFPVTPWGTMSGKFFDYNGDGTLDLYLTDMHSDMSEKIGPEKETLKANMQWPESLLQGGDNNLFGNAFYENYGAQGMLEVSDAVGVENYWPWGISVADLNADGYEDIFVVASMNYPFRYGPNSVYLNDKGKGFVDVAFPLAVEPRQGLSVKPWFELDCSGADADHERCTGQKGKTTVWGARGSRASVIFDYDGDGDNDIILSEFNEQPRLLTSNLAERGKLNYLKIVLVGSKSNRDGLGAMVSVTAGGRTQYRYHDGQTGYLSHGLLPLYFGLGDAKKVAQVRVQWPSGQDQVLTEVSANDTVTIREP